MKLSQICSPLLKDHLLHRLGDLDLTEKTATCDNCLCSSPQRGSLPYYDSHLKCCTFHPFLPNYAVGALLHNSAETPAFIQEALLHKIQNNEYALPLGIFAPVRYQVQFNNREESDFGNRKDFLCPYFDRQKNKCGIWLYRGSVCTSYFCASDRGEKGLQLWSLLGEYLHLCEMSLAQDCMVSMGMHPDMIDSQLEYINCSTATAEEMKSDSLSPALFASYWGDWNEPLLEFYKSSYNYVCQLNPENMTDIIDENACEVEEEIKKLLL